MWQLSKQARGRQVRSGKSHPRRLRVETLESRTIPSGSLAALLATAGAADLTGIAQSPYELTTEGNLRSRNRAGLDASPFEGRSLLNVVNPSSIPVPQVDETIVAPSAVATVLSASSDLFPSSTKTIFPELQSVASEIELGGVYSSRDWDLSVSLSLSSQSTAGGATPSLPEVPVAREHGEIIPLRLNPKGTQASGTLTDESGISMMSLSGDSVGSGSSSGTTSGGSGGSGGELIPPWAEDDDLGGAYSGGVVWDGRGAQIPFRLDFDGTFLGDYNVLDNDYDPDGTFIEFHAIVDPPVHGTITDIQPDGLFRYTPDPDWLGEDSFTYQIIDADGLLSKPAQAFIQTVSLEFDIEADSNNDKSLGHQDANDSDPEDLIEDGGLAVPGKRLFVNEDDDNRNGLADKTESDVLTVVNHAVVSMDDKDLAEAVLKAPGGPAWVGHKLVLESDGNLKLWGSRQKAAIDGLNTVTANQKYEYTILAEGNPAFPKSVFVEGMAVGTGRVYWKLLRPDGTTVVEDAVKFEVEALVWPEVNQSDPNWQQSNTSQWRGLQLAPAWYIDKALEDYINAPGDRGKIQTIHPDLKDPNSIEADLTWASKEGGLAVTTGPGLSGANFLTGFIVEFDYSFQRTRGDGTHGYVRIVKSDGTTPEKLSFVGNSGVKFGSLPNGKPFEAAILDVGAMFDLAGGWHAFAQNTSDLGFIDIYPYLGENLNTLMTGVAYGGDYMKMTDFQAVGPSVPPSVDDYLGTLVNNVGRANSHMKIEVIRTTESVYSANIYLNDSLTYSNDNLTLTNVTGLNFQSHWGSGVEFSNLQIFTME